MHACRIALMPADSSNPSAIGAELRTQKLHLEMVFNSARDMMMLAKVEPGQLFRVVSVNRPYVETIRTAGFNLTAGDLEGRTFAEVMRLFGFDAAAAAQIRQRYEQVIATGRLLEYPETTHTPAGMFHGRTTITPILDETGECAFLLYSSQDVTAAVRAEQARRESEEKFATVFREAPVWIVISDASTSECLEVNDAALQASGFRREEVIGHTGAELNWIRAEDRARLLKEMQAQGRVVDMEMKFRAKDGRELYGLVSCAPIAIGDRACTLSVTIDITARRQVETALHESEEKFAKAFLACPDAMSVHELESGRYVDVNEGFLRLFGAKREDVVGRTALELGLWVDPAERQGFVNRLRREGRVRNFRVTVRVKDGRSRICELSAELIEVGGRPHNVTVLNDITESLEAERDLRESQEKFAKAFRVSPDIMAITEFETGRYVDVNEAHERLFGFTREESLGRSPVELGLVPKATREELVHMLQRDGRVKDFRVEARNRRGEQVILLLSAERIRVGGRDCVLRCSHDITEQVHAEQALRASEEKFAKAFRASPYALTISEMATGRYVDVNGGFEQLSGYTREEVIGRTSLELNLWVDPAEREALVRRLQEKGAVRGLELTFRAKDGRVVSALCNCEPIEVAGVACLLNVLEDTTERRKSDEQKASLEAQLRQNQKLESLGTLAGGIAHDFNNILTAIIINQELALMDIDQPGDLRRRLAEIGQASGRAKELVRQILTFSRQQTHERLRQHLQMIIREALGLLRASLPATLEIKQELSPEAPPVLADASQIHQVVMNLCTNAAHAMCDRPGCITVRLTPRQVDEAACLALPGLKPGRYAWLSVTDTGHGMDASVLARIFEPFFTTKGPGEGTGLGLPMVHGIVRDHEGAIFVQSSPGNGTNFDLYFPEAVETTTEARVVQMGILPGRGEIVLVVDDEEAICEAVGAMLSRIGYRVQTFTDPQLALEHFRRSPSMFNLLLTDRTMPRMSGPQLIAKVRDWWPGLPALLMSGLTNTNANEGEAPGAEYGLVAKPIDIIDLSRAVRRMLDPTPSQPNAITPSP
jgi:two-component system, cell cycle sensor histidine kinase and response regulator CckA